MDSGGDGGSKGERCFHCEKNFVPIYPQCSNSLTGVKSPRKANNVVIVSHCGRK